MWDSKNSRKLKKEKFRKKKKRKVYSGHWLVSPKHAHNMFNNKQLGLCTTSFMDPRISFSNDFADTQQTMKHENIYREAPVSSDFEFSVNNYAMRSADEIIFQGMVLPTKDNSTNQLRKTTLKQELLVDDDDDYNDMFSRPPKSLGRWKERLGLKKVNILHRKGKTDDQIILERVVEEGKHICVHEAALIKKENQELLFEGGLKCIENAI